MKATKAAIKWPVVIFEGREKIRIYRRENKTRGYPFYQFADYSSGKRKMRSFGDLENAKNEARRIVKLLSRGDAYAASMTAKDRASYVRAVEIVAPDSLEVAAARYAEVVEVLGDSQLLLQAAREFARRHKVAVAPLKTSEAVSEFLKAKESKGASKRYLGDLRARLGRFAEAFQCNVGAIDKAMIQEWLDSLKVSARTYGHFRTVLNTFFEFTLSRNWSQENPVAGVGRVKVKESDKQVFTPSELRGILHHSDSNFIPVVCLGAFAGLRSAEIGRLQWEDFNWQAGCITIGAKTAKTGSRRLVPITDALSNWLAGYAAKTGPVWAYGQDHLHKVQNRTVTAVGIPWKHNALRHSFASYRLANIKDAAQVAHEMGNSASMVHRHYKELVTEETAREWFNIMPEASMEKIVQLG